MRYSGPRLIWKSPSLALHHVFDGRKEPQTLKEFKKRKTPKIKPINNDERNRARKTQRTM